MSEVEIRHFHLFCGLGGGAAGFNRGHARVGRMTARFRCLGGIDNDPAACRDFEKLAGAPATCLDLFSREQYRAFHGHEPPPDWREATAADIRRAAGNERPHIVFSSSPCKGFSGLLSERRSATARYQALNALALRGVWLTLEAWAADPPELLLFENVPRIASRGRRLIDQIMALLDHYGYAAAETTHDCGELGGLAQTRRRFLLVARHREKVPPFLYEPPKRRLRAVGEVLEKLPLPGDPAGGPMHRVPELQWRTWVRLAFVEAGSDWRSLNRLRVEDGHLADYLIVPEGEYRAGVLGVRHWDEPCGTVAGRSGPTNGAYSVADPRRPPNSGEYGQYGVKAWSEVGQAVTGKAAAGAGRFSVADPRCRGGFGGAGKYRVVPWPGTAGTVIGASTTGQGAFAVADPRCTWGATSHRNKLKVTPFEGPAACVTGADRVGSGALSVADPRPAAFRAGRADYVTGGHYGVVAWDATSRAVTGAGQHDNGFGSVADPRTAEVLGEGAGCGLPRPQDRGVFVIVARDGTWHRPFTTLELAALQSLVDPDEPALALDGRSESAWRERVGNAVPREAAAAIASEMGRTLLLAWSGQTFALGSTPIWVRPLVIAASVDVPKREVRP